MLSIPYLQSQSLAQARARADAEVSRTTVLCWIPTRMTIRVRSHPIGKDEPNITDFWQQAKSMKCSDRSASRFNRTTKTLFHSTLERNWQKSKRITSRLSKTLGKCSNLTQASSMPPTVKPAARTSLGATMMLFRPITRLLQKTLISQ